ncbi:MAG: DUF4139 domain-containing protein [Polyangiaceae bacterium]|nr:DUF4139 domain-containing protein [Polyangiaceae bacterium]
MTSPETLPQKPSIKRLVMFKHGVAFLERSGPAAGHFELTFRVTEMNDVLKSLAVWVAEGNARLLSVGFDAPEDPDVALAQRGLLLGPGSALDAMLASVRGRSVEIDLGAAPLRGEVLGIQDRTAAHGDKRRALLLRTSDAEVSVVDLEHVRSLRLLEQVSRDRLDFLVGRSQAATSGETRSVRIVLEGEATDLRVAYVIPAPVWRVSYRVVRDGDHATLMAMGIIHNPVDEDLGDVELTLTTGQPVSFLIDLYHPKQIERTVVQEETRAAAAPTRFERALPAAPPAFAPPPPPAPAGFGGPAAFGPPPFLESAPAPAPRMADSFGAAGQGASEGVERGELFEYRVASRLSIRRGGSAMVPLAATRVPAKRERVWRDGSGNNPDLVLSFKNETGLVLEEGPAVIYDDGVYAGESMLPYSARGVDVKMGFAKDLAVRVSKRLSHSSVLAGIRVDKTALVEEQRQEARHVVTAENDHDEDVEVIVELSKITGRSLTPDTPEAFEETTGYRRFLMKIPGHAKRELVVTERWASWRNVSVDSVAGIDLERWLRDKFIDDSTLRGLQSVLSRRQKARELRAQKAAVEAEQQQAYTKQTKLGEQLNVLKETGPEGALRLRYVKELEAEQDRVNRCEKEAARLQNAIAEEEAAAAAELASLVRR